MPKAAMNGHPVSSVLKMYMTTSEVERIPASSQGLNLPQRVRVLSMIFPMIGSLNASKIRAPIMMPVIAASWEAESSRVKSANVRM